MGLELNREKTRVVNLKSTGESLDFLGYTFRYHRSLKWEGTSFLNVAPSKKAVLREKAKLKEMTGSRLCFMPLPEMIAQINAQLCGWANYFSYGFPRKAKRQINRYVRERLVRHLRRRSQRHFRPPEGVSFYRHFANCGLVYL